MELPEDVTKIIRNYTNTRRLLPKQRQKLQNLFKLIYSNELWEE